MSQNPNNLRQTTSQFSQSFPLPPNILQTNPDLLKLQNPQQQGIQNTFPEQKNTFPEQKIQGGSSINQNLNSQFNQNYNIGQSSDNELRQSLQNNRLQGQSVGTCIYCQLKQKQIDELKKQLKKQKSDYEELEEEAEKQNKRFKTQSKNESKQQQQQQDESSEEETDDEKQRLLKKIQMKDKEIKELKENIETSESKYQELLKQINNLKKEKEDSLFEKQNNINYLQDMINKLDDELQLALQEKQSLQSQLQEFQRENQTLQEQEKELQKKIKVEEQLYQYRLSDIDELRKRIKVVENSYNIESQSKEGLQKALTKKNQDLDEAQANLIQKQDEISGLKEINSSLQSQVEVLKQVIEKNQFQENVNWRKEMENHLQVFQEKITTIEEKEKKKQKDIQNKKDEEKNLKEKQKLMIQELQKQQQEDKEMRIQQGKKLKEKMKESHGSLEVCFVIDVTESMDPYKDMAMKSVKQCMQQIKIKTNRDTAFSTVCYQDFFELNRAKGKQYQQLDFTKDNQQLEKFLVQVKCSGGGDAAEDVAGGLQQMCDKLSWNKPFRLAMLICDAPAHGKRFNGGCNDNHQTLGDDLVKAIDSMIKKEIILVALNFNKNTIVMYNEMQKIYEERKRSDLFLLSDLSTNPANVLESMIQKMTEASVQATHSNKKETKSKNDKPTEQKQNKDGAIEALCKAGNFFDFDKDPKVKIVKSNFKVYSASLNDERFQQDLENPQSLKVPQDYNIKPEGNWDCIRTQSPFAFGMMKEVYLMKKANVAVEELYVIKTPLGGKTYESANKAIEECRSHLICQSLMRMFMKDIRQACEDKGKKMIYPTVIYTDFLILEENPNSFWIAERFFKGEFVKYNNNFGYISEDNSVLNQMAQAFSYYTYFKSNFNYMINDVQGVGTYFTDPAINTNDGKFDETDMGQDGQGMFMVTYDLRKGISAPILKELLGIDDDA